MPELEPQSPAAPAAASATASPTAADAIASLHRMSTTAGISAGQYVAINNLAVAAALLGLATGLAFFGLPMLVLGGVALICGVVSIIQIRNSNGTQGGVKVAAAGMLLALLISGGVGIRAWITARQEAAEEAAVTALLDEAGRLILQAKFAETYDLLDELSRKRISLESFSARWKAQLESKESGKLIELRGNGVVQLLTGAESIGAMSQFFYRYENRKNDDGRIKVELRKLDGKWYIIDIDFLDIFGQQKKSSSARPAG